jgi:hypothetical protein
VVVHLPSKQEALSSNLLYSEKKKKRSRKESTCMEQTITSIAIKAFGCHTSKIYVCETRYIALHKDVLIEIIILLSSTKQEKVCC